MLGNVKTSSALYAFEKMEEKCMESQAEALNQLLADDLPEKFALLESSPVEDDLAQLKEMFMMKGELPAGRPIVFEDSELEKELN